MNDNSYTPNPDNDRSPMKRRPTVITSTSSRAEPEPESEEISLEEQMALAGLASDTNPLLAPGDYLGESPEPPPINASLATQRPERNIAQNARARTSLVVVGIGLLVLGVTGFFSLFQGGQKTITTVTPEPEAKPVVEEGTQSDEYKSRLALIDQHHDLNATALAPTPTPPESEPEPEPEATFPTSPATPASPRPAPVTPRPEPPIDPFDRWNRLATVGASGQSISLTEGIILTASPTPDTTPAEGEGKPSEQPSSSLAKATIGGNRVSLSAESPLADSSTSSLRRSQTSGEMTAGTIGILTRQPALESRNASPAFSAIAPTPTTYRIPLGASAAAEIAVPVLWIPDGQSPTQGRSAVTLTEPLNTFNNHEALPAGTVLITEVTNVATGSLVVEQTAIALVYEGSDGQIYQEEITPGVIIIRGHANQPLLASRVVPGQTMGRNLLGASMSALANIGARLAEPDFISTVSASSASSSSSTVVTRSEDEVLGAALEGFFGSISNDLEAQAELQQSLAAAQRPVLVVNEGTQASILVNGLLEVTR